METNCPVIAANVPHAYFPVNLTSPRPQRSLRWLLELETDGTIRYSNIHPQNTLTDGRDPVIGSNFFDLPEIGGLNAFKRDFVGFVKGDKNRRTFELRTGNGVYDDSTVIVLTRSFDTTIGGPSGVVILMELKSS